MLKAIFSTFETTEIQLTPRAIRRLRLSALMSLPALPCFAIIEIFSLPDSAVSVLLVIGGISILALLYCFLTRMANRLWIPERYLDEVEIERKRRSASLTFQILIGVFALLIVVSFRLGVLGGAADVAWSARTFTLIFGSLLCMALSIQTAIAAWMTEPLSDKGVDKVSADGRYKWIVLAILVGTAAFVFLLNL